MIAKRGFGSLGDPMVEARLARALLVGVRVFALLTSEDERALAVAEAVAERLAWPLHTWSVVAGVDRGGRERELGSLLARLRDSEDEAIWLLFEAGAELRSTAQRRILRELAQSERGPCLVLVEGDRSTLPNVPELEIEELALPDGSVLLERVVWIATELEPERRALADALRNAAERLALAGLGLPLERFDRVIAEATLSDTTTPASIASALARRRVRDASGTVLETIDAAPGETILGFAGYLEWLRERAPCATARGPHHGRDVGSLGARGLGLITPPGSGQALAVRVGAGLLELPLVRIQSTVADGPTRLATITACLARAAPVALWLDERDDFDGLVEPLARWLASRDRGVFVFLVLTEPDRLPTAFRAGQGLDELFAVELPSPDRRAALLEQWLGRVQHLVEPASLPRWLELGRVTNGCSARDLSTAVDTALRRAATRGTQATAVEFEAALTTRPVLAQREPERLEALRVWARTRARDVEG